MAISARPKRLSLKRFAYFTIDQFANLPDVAGNKIMGFNDLRDQGSGVYHAAAQDSQYSIKFVQKPMPNSHNKRKKWHN
jgi:hypothetical protein